MKYFLMIINNLRSIKFNKVWKFWVAFEFCFGGRTYSALIFENWSKTIRSWDECSLQAKPFNGIIYVRIKVKYLNCHCVCYVAINLKIIYGKKKFIWKKTFPV